MDFLQTFVTSIKDSVAKMIASAKYDRTVQGRITATLGNNRYSVLINGHTYNCKAMSSLNVGDSVYATIIQNDYRNIVAWKTL